MQAELDANAYQTGTKVSDAELAAVQLAKADFHGDWNHAVHPR